MNSAIAMHMEARQSDDPARVAILEQQLADLHHELVTDAHSSAFEEAGWVDEMGDGALSPLILDGKLRINPLAGFGTPTGGETWLLLTHNPGALTDQTLDVDIANSPVLASGLSYVIDTSNDGFVYLAVVPEAGTAGLFLLGLAALLRARKRR